jgi:MoxR-like ATPase
MKEDMEELREILTNVKNEVSKVIIGQEHVIDKALVAILHAIMP